MIAFGLFVPKFWGWQGPMNGTLSCCECRFRGGGTKVVATFKAYLSVKEFVGIFALTGGRDAKNFGH